MGTCSAAVCGSSLLTCLPIPPTRCHAPVCCRRRLEVGRPPNQPSTTVMFYPPPPHTTPPPPSPLQEDAGGLEAELNQVAGEAQRSARSAGPARRGGGMGVGRCLVRPGGGPLGGQAGGRAGACG